MKKILLFFALMLTICGTAKAEFLTSESAVGAIGTLNGREAVVVDLGGSIGKVAIATKNVGATDADPYGTLFSTVAGAMNLYDPETYKLEGGWYVPSNDELTALKSLLAWKSDNSAVYYKNYSDLQFPLRKSGQSYYGEYITSTTSVSGTYTDYAYLYIAYAYNKGEGFGTRSISMSEGHNGSNLVIRPFHKLPTKNQCLFYTSSDGNVVTPDNGNFNASIESNAYENGQGLITFNRELTSIGYKAFYSKGTLTSVTIPASVTSIGVYAFNGCSGLKTLTFAEGSQLETIENDAFNSSAISGELTFPASLKTIGASAFCGCSQLSSLTFAEGSQLETIEGDAFKGTSISGELTLPASLKTIGGYAFNECSGLKTLTFTEGSQLETIGDHAFSRTTIFGELTLPASLESIGEYAFYATTLTAVTIPASVKSIGRFAFNECRGLASLTFAEGSQLKTIGGDAFSGTLISGELTLPASLESIGEYAFGGCKLTNVYMSSEDLSGISNNAFNTGAVINVPVGLYERYKSHFDKSQFNNKVEVVPLSDWQEYTIERIEAAMETVNTLSETDKGAIAGYISTIESATTFDEAATAYYAALDLIDRQKAFETKAQEALGTLGTRKEGPAIKVTGNDGETIILFNVDKVEFIEMELFGQGKAEANGIGKVRWMQLWRGGPKFAVYNVGATSATEYGGYYCWGKSNDESSKRTRIYNDGSEPLAGDTDTATKLWGNNWRMPTEEELEALANPDNCDSGWTTVDGVTGFMFTGKGDYKNNSIFFPANGYYVNDVSGNKGKTGGYWASTPREGWSTNAAELWFNSIKTQVEYARRDHGYCVRAVLNENKQN